MTSVAPRKIGDPLSPRRIPAFAGMTCFSGGPAKEGRLSAQKVLKKEGTNSVKPFGINKSVKKTNSKRTRIQVQTHSETNSQNEPYLVCLRKAVHGLSASRCQNRGNKATKSMKTNDKYKKHDSADRRVCALRLFRGGGGWLRTAIAAARSSCANRENKATNPMKIKDRDWARILASRGMTVWSVFQQSAKSEGAAFFDFKLSTF